jgi:uncharacterized protein YhbP (UPF0306 family)
MRLEYINKKNKEEIEKWDSFVKESPQGSIFSFSFYLEALCIDYKVLCVFDDKDNVLAGVILAKNQINTYSNPMLDKYLGILLKNEESISQKKVSKQYKIMELIATEIKGYKSFDYYFHPNFKNWIPLYWKGFTQQTRYTYQINLAKSIETIEKAFHGNLRNDIKNAINQGVVVKRDIDFDNLYSIIEKTFRRQGSKSPFNKAKLESFINDLLKNNQLISLGAYNNKNQLVSACCMVFDENSSYFILNGIDIDNQVRGANALMIFDAIKESKEKGLMSFDFEGSMLIGVEQFYRRFGGELVPYYRIWNDNLFNYIKTYAKGLYKRFRYGR